MLPIPGAPSLAPRASLRPPAIGARSRELAVWLLVLIAGTLTILPGAVHDPTVADRWVDTSAGPSSLEVSAPVLVDTDAGTRRVTPTVQRPGAGWTRTLLVAVVLASSALAGAWTVRRASATRRRARRPAGAAWARLPHRRGPPLHA